MSALSPEHVIASCASVLRTKGLHALLASLNGRTRHRYTGVYAFDPPLLRSLCLFDRENPGIIRGGDTPMAETYCSIVGADGEWFATADAEQDLRLSSHPARVSVIAYCGVPLHNTEGTCFGTLCHFDLRPRLIPAEEVPILFGVAQLVAPYAMTLAVDSDRATARGCAARDRVEVGAHNEANQSQ